MTYVGATSINTQRQLVPSIFASEEVARGLANTGSTSQPSYTWPSAPYNTNILSQPDTGLDNRAHAFNNPMYQGQPPSPYIQNLHSTIAESCTAHTLVPGSTVDGTEAGYNVMARPRFAYPGPIDPPHDGVAQDPLDPLSPVHQFK